MEPSPTPTPDPAEQPLVPRRHPELPGVVVPNAAELVELVPATDETDARADFGLVETDEPLDEEVLREWFLEHMPDAGWDEGETDDGTIVFLHQTELSARHAEEGLKRTATFVFGFPQAEMPEGVAFTLILEMPEGFEPADEDADAEGEADGDQQDTDAADDGTAAGDEDERGDEDGTDATGAADDEPGDGEDGSTSKDGDADESSADEGEGADEG